MGKKQNKGSNESGDSVNLLTSILMRYPEVAAINFDPDQQLITFTFILSQPMSGVDVSELKKKLLASIDVYNWLEGRNVRHAAISQLPDAQLTRVEIKRDVDSLEQKEITMMVDIFRKHVKNNLVTEPNEDPPAGEEAVFQEELIDHMLQNVKETNGNKPLFAFRSSGRVLVFNK